MEKVQSSSKKATTKKGITGPKNKTLLTNAQGKLTKETNNTISDESNYQYKKRKGTSGNSGHLYETKLLSLILFRALHKKNITKFYLGTNIYGVGAFDDVVIKYWTCDCKKPKIIFMQAKHRDDPTKDKLTDEELLKQDGDFCLHKYFQSYIDITEKFGIDNDDVIYKELFQNANCEFIIYTSAMEQLNEKNKINVDQFDIDSLIVTSDKGKVFQLSYDNDQIKALNKTVATSRAVLLAKKFSKFIFTGNYQNIMTDDTMKMYHIFLAQNVVYLKAQDDTNSPYIVGEFKQTFLETGDEFLLIIKQTICKEMKNLRRLKETDIEVELKTLSFKLPTNFGNVTFCIKVKDEKKPGKIKYLCSKFKDLFMISNHVGSKYFIKIDKSIIGSNKILKDDDLKSFRLGGLVGNLLIFDNETETLKFNQDLDSLSGDSLHILQELSKDEVDLGRYRIDIDIHNFPKLSLTLKHRDGQLVIDFLAKLKFYTNQAKEDNVEVVLKSEIMALCNLQFNYSLFRHKNETIFLKFHDKVQKWWKQSDLSPYLTKTCTYYHEAEQDTLGTPLLSNLDYICKKAIKTDLVNFKRDAIEPLNIADFFYGVEKVMVIVSDVVSFTGSKMLSYFKDRKDYTYAFLDLDFVIAEQYLDAVYSEIIRLKLDALILIYKNKSDNKQHQALYAFIQAFPGKNIIITKTSVAQSFKIKANYVQRSDDRLYFVDLEDEIQRIVLTESKIVFQNVTMSTGSLADIEFLRLLKPNVLSQIIYSKIEIGETLANRFYQQSVDIYINQSICRLITINTPNTEDITDLFFISDSKPMGDKPRNCCDIVIMSESEAKFEEICDKNKHCNVHWFSLVNGINMWKKSKGLLKTLTKYIMRSSHNDCKVQPETLKDIKETLVVICAEPGMGKSTLLSHLAFRTKQKYPNMWVSVIPLNLNKYTEQFSKWKENKTVINLREAFMFLYSTIDVKTLERSSQDEQAVKVCLDRIRCQLILNDANEIRLENIDEPAWLEIDIFNYCYNKNMLALLFDGFDEICPDYTNEVIQLLCALKSSRVAHLWVATRPYNVLNQLQCALGTFPYTLEPLTEFEQKLCLQKIISRKLGPNSIVKPSLVTSYVQRCYKMFVKTLSDNGYQFTSIPQHIHMIANILPDITDMENFVQQRLLVQPDDDNLSDSFCDYFCSDIFNNLNLCHLYDQFLHTKFYLIRFGEKKNFVSFKDSDMRRLVENEYNYFINNHKKLAAFALYDRNLRRQLLSEEEIAKVYKFIETIKSGEEKTGVVEYVVDTQPKFVHLTFAEYFAMKFICDKLELGACTQSLWEYLINVIFLSDNAGIRRFVNNYLEMKPQLFDLTRNIYSPETVLDILLLQSSFPHNAFFFSFREEFDNITMFLLKNASPALNRDNIDSFIKLFTKHEEVIRCCLICHQVKDNKGNIIKYILKLIGKIDRHKLKNLLFCDDSKLKFNPLITALYQVRYTDLAALRIFMDELEQDGDLMTDIFSAPVTDKNLTFTHHLVRFGFFMCKEYLKKLSRNQLLKMFSTVDTSGRLPVHLAADFARLDVFDFIDEHLGRDELKKMCAEKDLQGLTPMHYLTVENRLYKEIRYYSDGNSIPSKAIIGHTKKILNTVYDFRECKPII